MSLRRSLPARIARTSSGRSSSAFARISRRSSIHVRPRVAGERDGAHFEVNMVFVVHWNFEHHHVSPLDDRIDDLAVDKIDVGHAEEKSQILAVGIFDIAPDAPVRFFDGNDRIAKHDMVLRRVAVAPVHEAHMSVVERVVDVVEVVADTPNAATSREISGFSNIG